MSELKTFGVVVSRHAQLGKCGPSAMATICNTAFRGEVLLWRIFPGAERVQIFLAVPHSEIVSMVAHNDFQTCDQDKFRTNEESLFNNKRKMSAYFSQEAQPRPSRTRACSRTRRGGRGSAGGGRGAAAGRRAAPPGSGPRWTGMMRRRSAAPGGRPDPQRTPSTVSTRRVKTPESGHI